MPHTTATEPDPGSAAVLEPVPAPDAAGAADPAPEEKPVRRTPKQSAGAPNGLSPEMAQVIAEVEAWHKPFLTPNRVGQLLGVTGETVIAMAERGDIDYVGFGQGGRIRIPKSAVLRLLEPPDKPLA